MLASIHICQSSLKPKSLDVWPKAGLQMLVSVLCPPWGNEMGCEGLGHGSCDSSPPKAGMQCFQTTRGAGDLLLLHLGITLGNGNASWRGSYQLPHTASQINILKIIPYIPHHFISTHTWPIQKSKDYEQHILHLPMGVLKWRNIPSHGSQRAIELEKENWGLTSVCPFRIELPDREERFHLPWRWNELGASCSQPCDVEVPRLYLLFQGGSRCSASHSGAFPSPHTRSAGDVTKQNSSADIL